MATLYIAPGGDDSTGDGTIGDPWRTLGKFFALPPNPGDTLYVRGGTYNNTNAMDCVVSDVQGTSGAPVSVIAYPGETPEFVGDGTTYNHPIIITDGSEYIVIDGIRFSGYKPTESALIWIGDATLDTGYVTIRNCWFTQLAGLTQNEHGVYLSQYSHHVTIEDCRFIGPDDSSGGSGVEVYHTPGSTDFLVRRNIFTKWDTGNGAAVQIWDAAATGQLKHNTFVDNATFDIDARYHSTLLIQDSAHDTASGVMAVYDPNDSADTTLDHNFYSQAFDANYYLQAGQSGINAASDGTDAGALDSSPGLSARHIRVAV